MLVDVARQTARRVGPERSWMRKAFSLKRLSSSCAYSLDVASKSVDKIIDV